MDWDDVRVFLAVARHGQMLGAARTLGLNHATVARRLTALETALGTKLLTRGTGGSELTAEGERFVAHAERVESEMLAATAAAGAAGGVAGTVRVGAPDGFGVGFLAPHLGALGERHEGLRIELVPVPRTFSLSRREADIAVTLERPRGGRLVARKLTDYRLGLYASEAYLARHPAPKTLADLAAHRLVGYVEDLLFSASLDYNSEFLKGWRSNLAISSAMGQMAAVRAGAGIGILHSYMARQNADLVPVLPANTLTRAYWTVIHEDLRAIRRVTLVADFLADLVARHRDIFA